MSKKDKRTKKIKSEAVQAGNNYLYNYADGSNYKKVAFLKNRAGGVTEPSLKAVMGQPQTTNQLVNKYGTYNIQPTNDSGNEFPCISQGFSRVPGAGRESHEAITHDDW